MRAKSLASSLIVTLSLGGLAFAQDAPAADEPSIGLNKVTDGVTAAERERVKLLDDDDVPAAAAAPAEGKQIDPRLDVNQNAKIPDSIKKMSDEDRRKLGSLLQDAATYLGGIRVQEAFEKLVVAEAMAPDYAPVHNLKGAAYTKLRAFDKAAAAFAKAVELDPKAFMSKFNQTEIFFVAGDFAKAEAAFKAMIAENPAMPGSTKSLIDFKLLICRLKQGDEAGARGILDTFDFLDDHPGYYFGNAAIHFSKDEADEAKTWMTSAERIYDRNQINIYTDSFIEVGWIENLQ